MKKTEINKLEEKIHFEYKWLYSIYQRRKLSMLDIDNAFSNIKSYIRAMEEKEVKND